MKFGNPYRKESKQIIIIDFNVYYEDALAIGFSKTKALKYAFVCYNQEVEKLKTLMIGQYS